MMNLILEGQEIVKQAITLYKGSGHLYEVFLITLVILFFCSKRHSVERRIVGYTVICGVILINPIVAVILKRVALETVYWRTLWLLPMSFIIVCSIIAILRKTKYTSLKILVVLGSVFIIIFTGDSVFSDENFHKTENIYKIPESVIEIADIILEDAEGEARVIAPEEISIWIREYSADIYLLFGRGYIWGYEGWNPDIEYIRDILREESYDVVALDEFVTRREYEYLVVESKRISLEDILQREYILLGETQECYILKKEIQK